MIGGLFKSASRVALVAAAGILAGGVAAQAADLGGNCCADLEERVAELEATAARKGNRKMSLTITGAVAAKVLWHDSDADESTRRDKFTIDQANGETSYVRFLGSASLRPGITVGFLIDLDVYDFDSDHVNAVENAGFPVQPDDMYMWVKSDTLGEIAVGRVDQAMDGINAISLAAIPDIQMDDDGDMALLANSGGPFAGGFLQAGDLDGTDDEGGSIRYVSPTIAGFQASASYGHNSAKQLADQNFDGEEVWSVALRYAGEFNSIRIAAGIGYEEEQDDVFSGNKRETLTGSASVMHVPTGLFVNFAAGEETEDELNGGDRVSKLFATSVVAGIEQNWFGVGKTTFYGVWNHNEYDLYGPDDSFESDNWGVGLVQQLDAAATTLHLRYNRYECLEEVGDCTDDANVVVGTAIVKF